MKVSYTKPLLPLRDIVIFPSMVVPLFVGREKSIKALQEVMKTDKSIVLVTQKNSEIDEPSDKDLYGYGCLSKVLQLLKLPDGTVKVLVEGEKRVKILKYNNKGDNNFLTSEVEIAEDQNILKDLDTFALSLIKKYERLLVLSKKEFNETTNNLKTLKNASQIANNISANLNIQIFEKQELLEILDLKKRLEKIYSFIEKETSVLSVEKKIRGRVKNQMEKTQREYYLNEQLKAIQKELGEIDEGKDELTNISKAIADAKMPKLAKEKCLSELKKLKSMSPMSAEATVVRNYLDWMTELPWSNKSKINTDLKNAQKILDEDHYGLDKVKERIIEFLAVQKRIQKMKGPILCLVGPPGVGKTSLGKSIAKATNRKFIRISLGGVRDEAEIRGHRRTYIGSLPGKIIQMMKKAGTKNPLFLLDEIDKVGNDYRGDPSSALLEALDPEQNKEFNDHYLEVDYDLSDVMFVTTANTLNILPPLLDRMEVIRLSGYTEDEKVNISQKFLIPKQSQNNGLKKDEWGINEDVSRKIVRDYTRESGVRNLEREISKIARKLVKKIDNNEKTNNPLKEQDVKELLGVQKYNYGEIEEENRIGVVTGLAWTEAGGEILKIETVVMPGKGKMQITGKLGDVMQESVKAAKSYIRSKSLEYGIIPPIFDKKDFHIHVPEGATPKDGPSAGVGMVTSIISAITEITVDKTVAMTGEITLRGIVLPIGGLKEKLLAAHRAGIKKVLIPMENKKDLVEIPKIILDTMEIIPVKNVDEVLKVALTKPLKRVEWVEVDQITAKNKTKEELSTH
ncbi:endopeptidase La [Pelagibacteraceae bacterium]|nr:endopeptidase La [Pelagibacteraceae bacterium]MDC0366672.1 endopeptidase La [Pelagibacteraceae bacterium]